MPAPHVAPKELRRDPRREVLRVNYPMAILIVVILVNYVGMTYGPIGAFLAEFFPSRIRYTSVSVPYHIGNGWGGGLVSIVTTSMYLATDSVGYALIYPIVWSRRSCS